MMAQSRQEEIESERPTLSRAAPKSCAVGSCMARKMG
jgi:hypothetical protein